MRLFHAGGTATRGAWYHLSASSLHSDATGCIHVVVDHAKWTSDRKTQTPAADGQQAAVSEPAERLLGAGSDGA